jgi:hypothetical protein
VFFPKAEVGTVEVLFLPPYEELHTFGELRGGLVMPTLPGSPKIGRQNLVVMSEEETFPQAIKLMSHLFLDKAVPNAPLWLHQGLATYVMSTQVQSGDARWRACFGFTQALDTRFFRMPLDKFFAVTWQAYSQSEPGFFLGTGQLLMDFIFHGDRGAHLSKLPAIFAAASQGVPGPQIMAATFPGMNLDQLGERLSGFKGSQSEQLERTQMCPLALGIPAEKVPDESDPVQTPVPPQEIDQVMAALKRLPHGDSFPSWYPPEMLRAAAGSAKP